MTTNDLRAKASIEKIEDRLKKLKKRYLLSVILNDNPLILSLRESYIPLRESERMEGPLTQHKTTLLCHILQNASCKITPPN